MLDRQAVVGVGVSGMDTAVWTPVSLAPRFQPSGLQYRPSGYGGLQRSIAPLLAPGDVAISRPQAGLETGFLYTGSMETCISLMPGWSKGDTSRPMKPSQRKSLPTVLKPLELSDGFGRRYGRSGKFRALTQKSFRAFEVIKGFPSRF
ncbi:MAG: hypothetical protein LBK00_07040 [Treponema sp.]|nr:hypothetical protein [Treponema sp.]